tara:strand:- start:7755 stop:8999 length:1245 start_codon:yes stop_codon:yes gene_type:complete
MIIPTIVRNNKWNCPLLPELLKFYRIVQQPNDIYIHWCEINDSPENHDFHKGNILPNLPKKLITDLRANKARLVVSTWQESVTATDDYPIDEQYDVDLNLERFCEQNNIPTKNVFWISGDLEIHHRQKSKKIKARGFTCYGHDIMRQVKQDIDPDDWKLEPITERQFKKKFICLQRWMKPGRLYWTWLMHQNDLTRHGYVSFADRIDGYGFLDKSKAFMSKVREYQKHMSVTTLSEQHLIEMWHGLADLGLHAPAILDVEDADKNWCAGADTTLSSLPYYNQSFASVITETDCESNGVFISEATFRPFIYQQPAIWVGSKGTVETLRYWGFETWDWLFTERYDYHDFMFDRFKLARTALEQICHLDIQDKKLLERIHEQNLYNWDHLQNGFKERQKNNFTGILKEIIHEDPSNW